MKKYSDEEIINEFSTFTENKYSLIISTSDKENNPLTNYSPFVEDDGKYYICISSMMPHYTNIVENEKAHILIIEDEQDAFHIYARKRMYFQTSTKIIEKNEENIFKLFDKRYGDKLSFFRTMKDFKIVELTPKEKSLVLGFAQAYKMDEAGNLKHKNISHK